MSKIVLVTGITGKQGGATAKALRRMGHHVHGLVRNPTSGAALALEAQGVRLVAGDFTNPTALEAAMRGVHAVFAMTTPFEAGVEAEVAQGKALVDGAAAARVEHFVYSSVASADQGTGIPHFESKFAVEQHLKASGLPWTVIAPVYFMENLFLPQTLAGLKDGVYAAPMPKGVALQQVAVRDIGEFAAHALTQGRSFFGERIEVAGDALSGAAVAAHIREVTSKPIEYVELPIEQIRAWMEDVALMYEWFISTGYSVDLPKLRARYPEIGWQSFGEWARTALADTHVL